MISPKDLIERGTFGRCEPVEKYLASRGISVPESDVLADRIGFVGTNNPTRKECVAYMLENAEGRLAGVDLRSIEGKVHYRVRSGILKAMFCTYNLRASLMLAMEKGRAFLVEGCADALSVYTALGPDVPVIPMLTKTPSSKALRVLARFVGRLDVMGDRQVEPDALDKARRNFSVREFSWRTVKRKDVNDPNDVLKKMGAPYLRALLIEQGME